MNLLRAGDAKAALAEFSKLTEGDSSHLVAMAEYDLGRREESDRILARLEAKPVSHIAVAMIYAWRGDRDRAFAWLERARGTQEAVWRFKYEPWRTRLGDDPRYAALLKWI